MSKVLITGGLGYIGSHTIVELIDRGYQVSIIDDLSNSQLFILDRIQQISGTMPDFHQVDLKEYDLLSSICSKVQFDSVIHFAAYKSVSESVSSPLKYYQNNLISLINVLQAMNQYNVKNLIFSSSCSLYGQADKMPITEDTVWKKAESPYAKTKQMCEEILMDEVEANEISVTSLRYFNPIGAHHTFLLGELPIGVPNNLIPFVSQTAAGIRKEISVFGGDYPTPDGTAIRDYIHVSDLAKAHVAALDSLKVKQESNYDVYNVGTGKGNSVLEVIRTFEEVNDLKLAYKIANRRDGDTVMAYADTTRVEKELKWKAEMSLSESLKSAWEWQKRLFD